jgi:hypothetical protein
MEYEIFSIALLNKETGEVGLIPSVEFLCKPRHIQLAELESCLKMYEEELGNIDNPENGNIFFEDGKGSVMNIKSGEVELAIDNNSNLAGKPRLPAFALVHPASLLAFPLQSRESSPTSAIARSKINPFTGQSSHTSSNFLTSFVGFFGPDHSSKLHTYR